MAIDTSIDIEQYGTDIKNALHHTSVLEGICNTQYQEPLRNGHSIKLPRDGTAYTVTRKTADGSIASWQYGNLTPVSYNGEELTWDANHFINKELTHEDVRNIAANTVDNTGRNMALAIREDIDAMIAGVLKAANLSSVGQSFESGAATKDQSFVFGADKNYLSAARGTIPSFAGDDKDDATVFDALFAMLYTLWTDAKTGGVALDDNRVSVVMGEAPFFQLVRHIGSLGGGDTLPIRYIDGQWETSLFGAFNIVLSNQFGAARHNITTGEPVSTGGKLAYPMFMVTRDALTFARDFARLREYPFGHDPAKDTMTINAQVQTLIAVEDARYLYRGVIRAEA